MHYPCHGGTKAFKLCCKVSGIQFDMIFSTGAGFPLVTLSLYRQTGLASKRQSRHTTNFQQNCSIFE